MQNLLAIWPFEGYWQVPPLIAPKKFRPFAPPDALYQYRVMPFGMKNAPVTFQRMVNHIVADIEGCEAYVDDLMSTAKHWETSSLVWEVVAGQINSEFG